jgi:hypothetical protein
VELLQGQWNYHNCSTARPSSRNLYFFRHYLLLLLTLLFFLFLPLLLTFVLSVSVVINNYVFVSVFFAVVELILLLPLL